MSPDAMSNDAVPNAVGPDAVGPDAVGTSPGGSAPGSPAPTGASPGAPLLRADRVTKRFGDLVAVRDVTLDVGPGEIVGLLGANGAGKTTLIRLLLGLLAPDAGSVSMLGGPPDRHRRRSLGYVSQGLGLYRDLTVAENVRFAASMFGVTPAPLTGDLAAAADRPVRDVPLGLQRRLAFQVALGHAPRLLVLDEPTSGVDPIARAALWDTVHEQAEAGVAVLVTTHYMQEAQQCDRLALMSRGRLVAAGSEAEVVGDTTAVEIRTGQWAEAFRVLVDAGQAVALAGTAVRVADGDAEALRLLLDAAGLPAQVVTVPATLEERMTVLARAAG